MFEEIFRKKKPVFAKLLNYGFQKSLDGYQYETTLMDDEFRFLVHVDLQGALHLSCIENATNEEYVLYRTSAQGSYVGSIRGEMKAILEDIANQCFVSFVYRQDQTLRLLTYVHEKYGDPFERLWEKTPDCGIWRSQGNQKWYGIIMAIPKSKLGFLSDEIVEIVDLRTEKEKMNRLLKRENYYPGWHMNKKSWFTIILDESISDEELFLLLDNSRALTDR